MASDRQRVIEQLDHNLLFRWFVGLPIEDPVWEPSTFSKNGDRLIEADLQGRRWPSGEGGPP